MKNCTSILLFLPLFCFSQTQILVAPQDTDPEIDILLDDHFVYLNEDVETRNKLFLFMPGTGGLPTHYQLILEKAANMGFHSIGLTYPNEIAIATLCSLSLDTTCHARARNEILDGVDRHNNIEVNRPNSIENRLLKLLQYLYENYPDDAWGQYWQGDSTIVWEKIIVSGHSQGGGHAGFISKLHEVARVAMFAAADRLALFNRNAAWVTMPGATPSDRYYGFIHDMDEAINFNTQQSMWEDYGMHVFGDPVLVDDTDSPYNGSRMLYTQETPALLPGQYHGCVAVSLFTPKVSGVPVFDPVWEYMFDCPEVVSTFETENEQNLSFEIYPNPVGDYLTIHLDGNFSNQLKTVHIFDLLGNRIWHWTFTNDKLIISTSSFVPGHYTIQLMTSDGQITSSFIKN